MTAQLLTLLEAATVGTRELDRAIFLSDGAYDDAPFPPPWHVIPHYTALLDSALTLMPEGWRWEVADYGGDDDGPRAALWLGIPAERDGDMLLAGASAATPTLALCIAALKAHEAGGRDG